MNYKRELKIAGLYDKDSMYGGLIAECIEELMSVFEKQGHSGYSASIVASIFKQLIDNKPLSPITGEDDEWIAHNDKDDTYQNNRCSAIFKKGKNGKPYYIDAILFKGDLGGSFTGSVDLTNGNTLRSRQYIKQFPFTPKTFYINVKDFRFDKNKETGELIPNSNGDWWEHEVEDEKQLEKVFEYYEQFT